jgi:serine/threonine protein kinase/formylglycine-generating enzyme required for sulfatase activity
MTGAPEEALSELEALVAEGLEQEVLEREAWLARLGERSSDQAADVRARLALLGELGLSTLRPRGQPARVGRFALEERVGLGGMGEVWRARDGERTVAVKLVRPELLWFEGARRRFDREVRAIAALDHPGIVKVEDHGDQDGLPWMALEWVDGASLEDVLDGLRGLSPHAAALPSALAALSLGASGRDGSTAGAHFALVAQLLAEVADALQHAHERGVLHRDVKPSNVLVGSNGRALLADFGLALSRTGSRMTRTGSWLGSLPYASPEQVEGAVELDARADVYSLGATLYECLTLHTPFLGGAESAVRARILRGELEPARRLNPSVPRGIDRVCRKAMDPDPARRYARAADLADDLWRFARGERPLAGDLPPWLRALRWTRRHPRLSGVTAVVVLTLVATTTWAVRERIVSARIQRMSDSALVERLEREAALLWPPALDELPAIDAWLDQARPLLARRAAHEADLRRLRASAVPYDFDQAQQDRGEARRFLVALRLELEGLANFLSWPSDPSDRRPMESERIEAAVRRWSAGIEADPRGFAAEFRDRLAQVRSLVPRDREPNELSQLADFERRLVEREPELVERRSQRFADEVDQWRHDELDGLVRRLEGFEACVQRVRDLRRRCEELGAEAEETRRAWALAARAIRASDRYGGLRVEPTLSLRPLRENPVTGLWEFLLLGTGEAPLSDPTPADPARYRVSADTGVVLVLLPGGELWMGAPAELATGRLEAAGPRHRVVLAPFYVSKYELTVGQAERFQVLPEPLQYQQGGGERPLRIDWELARELIAAYGFDHPTEAQWEYAASAGGLEVAPLRNGANLRDDPAGSGWHDGFPDVAPVGSFPPNAFGLYDCLGNVAEWCRDLWIWRGYSTLPGRPGDGFRETAFRGPGRATRGGSFTMAASACDTFGRGFGHGGSSPMTGVRPTLSLPLR